MTCLRKWNTLYTSLILILILVLSAGHASAEVLFYDLKWLGIKAGSATLSFYETRDRVMIVSEARSDPWVDLFYKVRDRVVSHLKKDPLFSLKYRITLREGSHRKDREVLFYPEPGVVLFRDYLSKEEKKIKVPDALLDPLGGFYVIRHRGLRVGRDEFIRIFDSKKVYDVRVEVIKKETIETSLGRFRTIVIKPHMKSEGIFYRKGEIYIYLTDDERHIPVMLRSKILIGSVVAELKRIVQ